MVVCPVFPMSKSSEILGCGTVCVATHYITGNSSARLFISGSSSSLSRFHAPLSSTSTETNNNLYIHNMPIPYNYEALGSIGYLLWQTLNSLGPPAHGLANTPALTCQVCQHASWLLTHPQLQHTVWEITLILTTSTQAGC